MKTSPSIHLIATVLTGCVLSSCVYDSNPVPEMPYSPKRPAPLPPKLQTGAVQTANPGNLWAPGMTPYQAPALSPMPAYVPVAPTAVRPVAAPVAPVVRPAVPVIRPVVRPVTPVAPKVITPVAPKPVLPAPTSSHITQPSTPAIAAPTAMQAPVVSTVTPPAPTSSSPAPTTPTDPKLITNTGPIPVATRVEGDPIRVYNPLDPTKTIRIIDPKTGKVHPSGKVLKVKNTNFKFIVP